MPVRCGGGRGRRKAHKVRMEGQLKKWRTSCLCGSWALSIATRLPNDVIRYIARRYTEWEHAYCWICFDRLLVHVRPAGVVQTPPYLYEDMDDRKPICNRHMSTYSFYNTPKPHYRRDRLVTAAFGPYYWFRVEMRRERSPEEDRQILVVFDFLCSLSDTSFPASPFDVSSIQLLAVELARQRDERENLAELKKYKPE